jgi:hypothetical protein
MEEIHKFIQRNSRRIFAGLILFAALMSMLVLSGSGPTSKAWIATRAIPAGTKVLRSDINLIKVNLTTDSDHYLSGSDSVVGRYLLRPLIAGDLISSANVMAKPIDATLEYVPVGIAANDFPSDLAVSDLVNIYVIPRDQATAPALIAMHVSIQRIDPKSQSLGGTVGISFAANAVVAHLIVDAESQGRLVIARAPF